MKKYITAAALLAAGTALANAVTSASSYTTSTLELSGSSYIVTVTFDGAKLASGYAGGDGSNADVFLYFTGTYYTSDAENQSDVNVGFYNNTSGDDSVDGHKNATGFWSCLTYDATSGALSGWSSKNPNSGYLFNRSNGGLVLNSDTSKSIETVSVSYGVDTQKGSGNYTNTGISVSVLYVDGTTATLASNVNSWLGGQTSGAWTCNWTSYSVADLDCIKSVSVTSSNSALTTDALTNASISAIPEPSAFGLLAGVGALALVASRRRRAK